MPTAIRTDMSRVRLDGSPGEWSVSVGDTYYGRIRREAGAWSVYPLGSGVYPTDVAATKSDAVAVLRMFAEGA